MTDIKSAIEMLVNATYSDEWQGNEELTKAQHLAINSLQAWSEVLQELEQDKEICFAHDSDEGFVYARVIDFINQKLEEIEEVREKK